MISSIFQNIIRNPLVRAQVLAQGRHVVTYIAGLIGGAIGTLLIAHGVDSKTALSVGVAVTGIVVSLGSWAMSAFFVHQDVKGVDAKMNAAIALAPQTPQETIAALKAGKF